MHQFENGDRVVYVGGPGGSVKPCEEGIVESVSPTDSNTVYVRTEQGRVVLLSASNLELVDLLTPS